MKLTPLAEAMTQAGLRWPAAMHRRVWCDWWTTGPALASMGHTFFWQTT